MKISNSYFLTYKENVKDEDSISSNLLVRAGMIKKTGSGIYTFLPMGLKVIRKIENIVREEMNNIDSLELIMPSLLPEEVYIASGRRDAFGKLMFSLSDQHDRNYVLGPTHEEMFVNVAKDYIKSYKDMPLSLYQMATKYRDEYRPRFGLVRTREFVMKDAYTFDKDLDGLDISYNKMFEAYKKIFDKIGIEYKIVKASTGAMGGLLSEEFQAISSIGEDTLVICDNCGLSTNIEICECIADKAKKESKKELELIPTPNKKGINEICDFLKCDIKKTVKTLIYKANNQLYAVLVRGDREVNENKLATLLGVNEVELSTIEEDISVTHAEVGFAGPIGLEIPIIVDNEVMNMYNYIAGANKTDYHYLNVNNSDFNISYIGDIRNVCENDLCPVCGSKLVFKKGIEVGNTFKLGDKYCKSMGLTFTDLDNSLKNPVMGCYGIGIARTLSAYIEQHHDENGIIFNDVISPFDVELIVVNTKDELQKELADKIYSNLKEHSIDVLYDDRDERIGVKFGDADLIGIPKRIIVGRDAKDNKVEFSYRNSNNKEIIDVNNIINKLS